MILEIINVCKPFYNEVKDKSKFRSSKHGMLEDDFKISVMVALESKNIHGMTSFILAILISLLSYPESHSAHQHLLSSFHPLALAPRHPYLPQPWFGSLVLAALHLVSHYGVNLLECHPCFE